MEKIAEAAAAVGAARRRLAASRVADGVARGALVGAIAGGAAWLVSRWTPGGAGLWPLAAPVLGAACGAVLAMRRGVPTDVAALTLDAAARTDEAFVSALSVRDAAPQVRELVAAHAVERCPPSAVSRFLPFRAPGAATAAVVASALLAALVLVPRATATDRGETHDLNAHIVPVIGATSGSVVRPSEPSDRVRWTKELAEEQGEIHPTWAPAAREDLASVPSDEVRSLAEALASLDGAPAEAAKRALAAAAIARPRS
jgi:hypothetical protein